MVYKIGVENEKHESEEINGKKYTRTHIHAFKLVMSL